MKTEMNIENKARFFAQYYDQQVAWCKNSAGDFQLFRVISCTLVDEVEHLRLTPLSALSDEQAIEVAKIFGHTVVLSHYGRLFINRFPVRSTETQKIINMISTLLFEFINTYSPKGSQWIGTA